MAKRKKKSVELFVGGVLLWEPHWTLEKGGQHYIILSIEESNGTICTLRGDGVFGRGSLRAWRSLILDGTVKVVVINSCS